MIYIIDLREEHELSQKRIISNNEDSIVLSIPSRYIFANKEYIDNISRNAKVYLLCRTGNRSGGIKAKYFKNNENIISVDGGLKSLDQFGDRIEIIKGNGGFGIQQYMQIVFTIIIIITIIALYYNIDRIYILVGLISFLAFILYQIFSNSCILSKMIPYKN